MKFREFLKRIGVVGVVLGLTASPLAFATDTEKEDEFDTTTGQETKEKHQGEGDKGKDDSTRVSPDPDEAGAPGVEGSEGTQAGDEPDPAEGNDADTQEGDAS